VRQRLAATENDDRRMFEGDKGCEGGGHNEKLITSSIKIAMIHHDVWKGCSSRSIKRNCQGRQGLITYRIPYI
jgi:hypothetical protein